MAANKRKILENARKLAQKGSKDKALKEYQKLVKLDPKDAKLRLEIGDAYRRWGQVDEAIDTYTKVADQYMKEGFDARAVAVYKQILNLDPERYDSYPSLAELYERMGLTAEAIGALQTAADGYHREGKKKEALDLLRRMATIDPSNTTSRIKVAELLLQEGMQDEAIQEYEEVAVELTRQSDDEAAGKVYRRILELQPDRSETLVVFARNLLSQNLATEAEAVAKKALSTDDQNPEHYEVLAETYRAQGRDDLLPEVYRPLADVYRQRGDEDKAREILQRFGPTDALSADTGGDMFSSDPVEFDAEQVPGGQPMDELSVDGSAFGSGGSDELELGPELELDGDGDALELSTPLGSSGSGESFEIDDPNALDLSGDDVLDEGDDALDLSGGELELGADATISSMERQGPVAAQPDKPAPITGDPDQLLAEASVYLRYGKRERAIAHLEAILEQEPLHLAALEKLGEAYAEGSDDARAVECWLDAAKVAQQNGDAQAVGVLRGRIEALDPAAAARLGPAAGSDPAPAASGEDDLDLDLDIDVDEPVIEEAPAAPAAPPAAADADIDIDIDIDDPDDDLDDLGEEVSAPEIDAGMGSPVRPAAPEPAAAQPAAPAASASASLSSTSAQQIQEDLEEADFYMEQGLHDEAQEIYQRVLALAPNHPKALLRLGEVAAARGEDPGASGTGATPQAPPAPEAAPPPAPEPAPQPTPQPEVPALDIEPPVEDLAVEAAPEPPPVQVEVPDDAGIDLSADLAPEEESVDPVDEDTGVEVAPQPDVPAEEETGEFSVPTEGFVERPSPPPAAGAGEGFDLAAELSDVFEDEAEQSGPVGDETDDGFAAVFDAFKKGVSQTLSEADHEAHYDLGIAYKEMGLFDDAIQEFRAAMVHPPRVVECLHMIAICGLDAGQYGLAVEHLEQLLETDDAADDQRLAARFDLGRAHEALGNVGQARVAWEQVAGVDASFQNVSERLAGLPENKPDVAESAEDEGFEDFEDMLSEVEPEATQAEAGESFDDLIAEVSSEEDDTEDEVEATPAPDPEPAVAVTPEPEPAPEPAAQAPAPQPDKAKKKRKKISFL